LPGALTGRIPSPSNMVRSYVICVRRRRQIVLAWASRARPPSTRGFITADSTQDFPDTGRLCRPSNIGRVENDPSPHCGRTSANGQHRRAPFIGYRRGWMDRRHFPSQKLGIGSLARLRSAIFRISRAVIPPLIIARATQVKGGRFSVLMTEFARAARESRINPPSKFPPCRSAEPSCTRAE